MSFFHVSRHHTHTHTHTHTQTNTLPPCGNYLCEGKWKVTTLSWTIPPNGDDYICIPCWRCHHQTRKKRTRPTIREVTSSFFLYSHQNRKRIWNIWWHSTFSQRHGGTYSCSCHINHRGDMSTSLPMFLELEHGFLFYSLYVDIVAYKWWINI